MAGWKPKNAVICYSHSYGRATYPSVPQHPARPHGTLLRPEDLHLCLPDLDRCPLKDSRKTTIGISTNPAEREQPAQPVNLVQRPTHA